MAPCCVQLCFKACTEMWMIGLENIYHVFCNAYNTLKPKLWSITSLMSWPFSNHGILFKIKILFGQCGNFHHGGTTVLQLSYLHSGDPHTCTQRIPLLSVWREDFGKFRCFLSVLYSLLQNLGSRVNINLYMLSPAYWFDIIHLNELGPVSLYCYLYPDVLFYHQGEVPPHAFNQIPKNLNKGMVSLTS